MMNEILVAVDGSKHSFKVVDVACDLAKRLSAGILLVSVIQLPTREPEEVEQFERVEQYPDAYADYLKELSDDVTSKFTDEIQKAGVPVRATTPSGHPSAEILEVARVEQPEMIVIGVKGLHGLAVFKSMGSVARHVIENSTVPVLVVPSVESKS